MRFTDARSNWSLIHKRRLQWADRGWKSFVKSLKDPAVQELYRQRKQGQPIVITYGPSQVGKSTVLLQMLGIDPTSSDSALVEKVLRGGEARATSATATALRYRISPDSKWHLSFEEKPPCDTDSADEATAYMAMIRAEIVGRLDARTQPAQIFIPRQYVAQHQNCIAIDLPGLDSSNDAEQFHVQAVMERWFPAASTILIVLRARHLSDLNRLAKRTHFADQPSRYRLLLTQAVSEESERHFFINKKPGVTLAAWREHILPTIQRTVPGFPEKLAIFPFEVGDSRRKLSAELRNCAAALLAESEAAVRQDLSVTSEALLAQQAEHRVEIEARYRRSAAGRQQQIAQLGENIKSTKALIEASRQVHDGATRVADAAKDKALSWKEKKVDVDFDSFPVPPLDRSELFGWMTRSLSPWIRERIEHAFTLESLAVPQDLRLAQEQLREDLTVELRRQFSGIWGWFTRDNKRSNIYHSMITEALAKLREEIQQAGQEAIIVQQEAADKTARRARRLQWVAAQHLERQVHKLSELEAELASAIKEDERLSAFEKEELERVDRFWNKLEEAWLRQDQRLCHLFKNPDTRPISRFYIALERSLRAVAWKRLRGAMT